MPQDGHTSDHSMSSKTLKEEQEYGKELEAAHVYLLLKKDLRISRNLRAEWYLEHLNTVIRVPRWKSIQKLTKELEVVSVEPFDPPADFDNDTAHEYRFRITRRTSVHCLARKYRLVYGLDLSPSMCRVILGNDGRAHVLLDKVHTALADAIRGVLQPFLVPGSELMFYPVVYVTVLAHTNLFRCDWQLVLVQGWYLMRHNLDLFLRHLKERLDKLNMHLAETIIKLNLKQPPLEASSPHTRPPPPPYDHWSVDGDSSLDADLDVSLDQSYDPAASHSLLSRGSRLDQPSSGSFTSSTLSNFPSYVTRTSSPVRRMKPPSCTHAHCESQVNYAKYLDTLSRHSPLRLDHSGLRKSPGRGRTRQLSEGGGSISSEDASKRLPEPVISSDLSLVNLLRYCVVALQLLPEKSISGIVVITDGVCCMSNVSLFDAFLNHMRNSTISISFLHLTSKPTPILGPPPASPYSTPSGSPTINKVCQFPDPEVPFHSTADASFLEGKKESSPSLAQVARAALHRLSSYPAVPERRMVEDELSSRDASSAVSLTRQQMLQMREESLWRQSTVLLSRKRRQSIEMFAEEITDPSDREEALDYFASEDDSIFEESVDLAENWRTSWSGKILWHGEKSLQKTERSLSDERGLSSENSFDSYEIEESFQIDYDVDAAFEEEVFGCAAMHQADDDSFSETQVPQSSLPEIELLKGAISEACLLRRQNKHNEGGSMFQDKPSAPDHPCATNRSGLFSLERFDSTNRFSNYILGSAEGHYPSSSAFSARRLQNLVTSVADSLPSQMRPNPHLRPGFLDNGTQPPSTLGAYSSQTTTIPWGGWDHRNKTNHSGIEEEEDDDDPWMDPGNDHFGLVSYTDLLKFLASATGGAYMDAVPQISEEYDYAMSLYHKTFLCWDFQQLGLLDAWGVLRPSPAPSPRANMLEQRVSTCVRERTERLDCTARTLLSCRLREGFRVRAVDEQQGRDAVALTLPWKHGVLFHYTVSSSKSRPSSKDSKASGNNSKASLKDSKLEGSKARATLKDMQVRIELHIEAPYEFLVDLEKLDQWKGRVPYRAQQELLGSEYRYQLVTKYRSAVRELKETDELLVRLHNFACNSLHYTVPQHSTRGLPFFYYKPNVGLVPLNESGVSSSVYEFWRPLCLLEVGAWHKWLHTHRIGLVLEHDAPLPRTLHSYTNNRFGLVQCRLAELTLGTLLAKWCHFVLLEGQTYVKFLYKKDFESAKEASINSSSTSSTLWSPYSSAPPAKERGVILRSLTACHTMSRSHDSALVDPSDFVLSSKNTEGISSTKQFLDDLGESFRQQHLTPSSKTDGGECAAFGSISSRDSGLEMPNVGSSADSCMRSASNYAPSSSSMSGTTAGRKKDRRRGVPCRGDGAAEAEVPLSFILVRISPAKPPCITVRLAFLGGTPGVVRQKLVEELRALVSRLTLPLRPRHGRKWLQRRGPATTFSSGVPASGNPDSFTSSASPPDTFASVLDATVGGDAAAPGGGVGRFCVSPAGTRDVPAADRAVPSDGTRVRAGLDSASSAAALAAKVGVDEASMGEQPSSVPLPCCVITHKQIDKILIWYQSMPRKMLQVMPAEAELHMSHPLSFNFKQVSVNNQAMLSRYLHHRRWIWSIVPPKEDVSANVSDTTAVPQVPHTKPTPTATRLVFGQGSVAPSSSGGCKSIYAGRSSVSQASSVTLAARGEMEEEQLSVPPPDIKTLSRILHSLTRIRLNEGFKIAFSHNGMITMVREVMMKLSLDALDYNSDVESDRFPCVLQYVLFPPHFPSAELGLSDSDHSSDEDAGKSDDDDEQDGRGDRPARETSGKTGATAGGGGEAEEVVSEIPLLQLVTECWVEPQNGLVAPFVLPPHCPSVAHTPLCHTPHLVGLPYYQLPQAILTEDRKVVNALLTFDFLAKISHLPPKYHKPAFAPHTSIQAFIRSLLRPPAAPTPATLCDVGAPKSAGVSASASATNLSSKTAGLYLSSAIIRTNSTTLPARDVGDFRDSRLRAGTLSPRVAGLPSDRNKLRGMAGFDETIGFVGCGRIMTGPPSVLGERVGAAAVGESGHLTSSFPTTSGVSSSLEHPLAKAGAESRSNAGGFSGLFPSSRSSSVSSNRQTSATEALCAKGLERPGPEGDQDRVQVVSFEPEVAELLQYCTQAEVLLSTFTQDLYYRLIKSVPCSTEDESDATNRVLYSLLLDQLLDLHNGHEIPLSAQDHRLLPQLLRKRHEHRSGCFAEYFVECEEEVPKWRCLVKASSSTKLLLTLLPASYHDLKLLLLHRSNLTPDCSNPALRLVSPYDDFLKLEKEASQESSDRSELLLLHRGSTESNGSSVLVSGQSMSQRSSTLSSSGQYGGRHQGGLGSSSSGVTSGTLHHHHLMPHQQSLPTSPRPSSSLTFSKMPSDGIVPSASHQHLPVRTRFKSGPSHPHHTQKTQLSSGPSKEGFSRARASSFHDRRERSGSLSQWLRSGERCRRGSVGEGSEGPSPQVPAGGQMSPVCHNPHCHHSLHLRHANKQQSQQQVPYHVQVAKQHSAPTAEKSRKRYVSMPMKSLPTGGGGASPCPHELHGRSMSASVSTEALHGATASAVTEKMASNSSSGRTGEASGSDRAGGGPEKSSSHRPLLGALTLPIYLYDCRLDIIISQLVHRSKTRNTLKDIFKDFTLHTDTIPTTDRVSRSGKKEDDRDESYYSERHFMPAGDESEDRCSDVPSGAAGPKVTKGTEGAIHAGGIASETVVGAIDIITAGETALSAATGAAEITKGSTRTDNNTVGAHGVPKMPTTGGETDTKRSSSRFMTAHEASRKRHTCEEADQRGAETSSSLVWLATAVEACQYRCLVVSSFEALRAGLSLHPTDLNPVLDQCHESVHEIDITEYLHAICGHLRDFSLRLKEEEKQQLLQNHRSPATPSPSHVTDLDNWDKQGTLEQMESVEQLGHPEQNLVRRTNTRDELGLARPNSGELQGINPRARQFSESVRPQAECDQGKLFTFADSEMRPFDKAAPSSDFNLPFDKVMTNAELKIKSCVDSVGVQPDLISPSGASTEKSLTDLNLAPIEVIEERESKSIGTLVRSETSKTGVTTASAQRHEGQERREGKSKSSTESGGSQPRPVLERQDSLHDDHTLSFDQHPTGVKTSPAKHRPPRMSRRSTSNSTSTSSLFPLCLLEQHQPCRPLQSLHSSIRQRCAGVLTQHYVPVPSMPDHHFYMGGPPSTCAASSTIGPGASQGLHGKVRSFSAKRSLKYQRSVSGCGGGDEDGGSGSWTAVGDEMDSTVGEDYVDGDDALDPSIEFRSDASSIAPRRLHSLASYHDFDEDGSSLLSEGLASPPLMGGAGKSGPGGSGPLPLFLHLTCTLRCPGIEPITTPMTSLPTCLRDVIPSLLDQELDLRELRLSLDVLSLTLPPSLATPLFPHVIPSSASANLTHQQQQQVHRRRRKSSSGVFYRFSVCSSSSPPPCFLHRGPLGEREACDAQQLLSDLDESVEEDPIDMLPEEQRLAITNTTQQLSWLVLDEVCAIGLQELPLTEATVSRVVQHVRRSQHCPNADFTAVPLDFVTGGRAARDVFTQEFDQLSVYQGEYRLHKLGRHHVLVLGNRHRTRHLASLVPPLAPLTTATTLHSHKLSPHDNDVMQLATQQQGVAPENTFTSTNLQKLGDEPLYTAPSVLRARSPLPRDSELASVYSKRPQPAYKEASPTKLSRRVSFHTLDAEESQEEVEPGAGAEKLKWLKRRERKERRDSERRGSVSTSDSDGDNDVHHRAPYSRECSQPREKSRDKDRSKYSRERATAASSVKSGLSVGHITATSGALDATTGSVVTASSGALTVTSVAYSDVAVGALSAAASTGAVCASTGTSGGDASSGVESSELGDVVDGASMSRQPGLGVLQPKPKKHSSLLDVRNQRPKLERYDPSPTISDQPLLSLSRQTDACVSYSELERGSVITCGGIQQQELFFTLEGEHVSMATNDPLGLDGSRRKPLHASHVMSRDIPGNLSHPPLRRTSGSGAKEVAETVRKSASSDECTAAARRDAARCFDASDIAAAPSLSRRRHFSATALETCPRAVSGESTTRHKPEMCHATATSTSAATAASAGLASDVSSLLESGQTTDIGCEGDISESDDCADWLQEFETAQPCLPRFWLIMHVGERCVTVYFHCRLPSDVCHYMCVLEDTLSLVSALVHHVNQSLLLHSLHNTRLCHSLLTPPSPGTPWGDTYIVNAEDDSLLAEATDDSYREASLRHEPGTFQCPIVWSTSFPLHPRLKAGYGTKGGSKGLQALRSTLSMFSVNNRTNMFVYQDTSGPNNNDNVFYLKLSELISPNTSMYGKRGSNPSHPSGSLSGSSSCATVTGLASACNAGAATSNISGTIISNVPSCGVTSGAGSNNMTTLQHNVVAELTTSAPQSFSAADSVYGVAAALSDLARCEREDLAKASPGIVRNSSKEEESVFPHAVDAPGVGFGSTSSSLVTAIPDPMSSGSVTQVLPPVCSAASTVIGDPRTRVSSFGERDVIMEGVAAAPGNPARCSDFIELIVHGIAQPGPSIREELVSMLQKRLDEAVLDAVCVMLWNNPQYKLPVEDVHFIQPPKQDPQLTLKLSIGPCPGQQLPSLLLYLRQNMQAADFSKPKYADARASSHFQDVCAGEPNIETDDDSVFLFISKRMSGACGIACITMALEDRNSGLPVQLKYVVASAMAKESGPSFNACTAASVAADPDITGAAMSSNSDAVAPHTSSEAVSAAVLLSQNRFDVLTRASDLRISEPTSESNQERVASTNARGDGHAPTDCVVRFRVWTIGRVAQEDMSSTLRQVCRHALWDLHTEHQLLTPHLLLCNALAEVHRPSAADDYFGGAGATLDFSPTTHRGRLMSAPSAALAFQRRFSLFSSSRPASQLPRRGSVAAAAGAPGASKLPYFGLLETRRASIPCALLETRLDSVNRGAARVHPDTADGGAVEGPIRIPRRHPSVPGGGTPSSLYANTSVANDLDDEKLDLDEEDETVEDEESAVEREMLEMLNQKELDVQYARVVVPWLQFGASLHVPTVRSFNYDLPNSGSVCAFLEELQRWLSVHSDESPLTCYQRSSLADLRRQVTKHVKQRLSSSCRQARGDAGQAAQKRGSLHGSSLKMDKPKKPESQCGSQKLDMAEELKMESGREPIKGSNKLDAGARQRHSAAKDQFLSCKRFVSFVTEKYEKTTTRQTKSSSPEYTYLLVSKYKPSGTEFRCESSYGETPCAQPAQECLLFARSPPNSAAAADLSYKTQLDSHRPSQLFLPTCLQVKHQIFASSSQSTTGTPATCLAQTTPLRSTSPIRSRASHPCYSASPAVPSRPCVPVPQQNLHQSLPSVTMSSSVDVSNGTGGLPYFRLRRDSASASTTAPLNSNPSSSTYAHASGVGCIGASNIVNLASGTAFDAFFSQSDLASTIIGRGASGTEPTKCRTESSGSGNTVSTVTEAASEGAARLILLPRHTLLAAFVLKNQVGVLLYNWSRESAERLNDHLTLMLQWTSARHALLSSIALQKLGLFHDQPFCRLPDDDSISARCAVNDDARIPSTFFRARPNAFTRDVDQRCELTKSSRPSSVLGTTAIVGSKTPGDGKSTENPFLNNVQLLERLIKLPAPTRDVTASVLSQQKGPRRSNSTLQPPLKFTSQQQQLKFMHQQRFGPLQRQQQQELKKKKRETASPVSYNLSNYGEAFMWRGYPSAPLDVSGSQTDPLQAHGAQFLAQTFARADRVEARVRLGEVLVCAGSTAANSLPLLDHRTLALVLRHATLHHFVYSPLLFLPRWRDLVAATRDHSLAPPPMAGTEGQSTKPQVAERSKQESASSLRQSLLELRRGSTTSLTPSPLVAARAPLPPTTSTTTTTAAAADPLNISGRRRHPTGSSGDDRWHQLLCTSLLKEYIQYLQSHGFKTLPKHASLAPQADAGAGQQAKSSSSSRFSDDLPSSTFLLLSLRSGAIVLKLFFQEPFFCATLYTLDLCKLRRRPAALVQQHAMNQFMSEVENVRVLLHLHSFAHDFHLRTLGGYLAGRQLIFNRGYHLSAFLANFTHYYKKAANFARNMIYSGSVSIPNTGVSPDQLYNYLLSKEKQYHMAVMRMTPTAMDDCHDMLETEYVLVHVHTCFTRQLPHHPKLAEEYEAILLVARDTSKAVGGAAGREEEFTSSSGTTTAKQDKVMAPLQQELDAQEANAVQDDQTLFLKFYLILTSKRELYPSHVHVQPSRRLSSCHRRTSDRMDDPCPAASLTSVPATAPAAAREPGDASTTAAKEAGGRYRTLSTAPPTPTPRTPRTGSAASRLNESASHTGSEDEVSASAASHALDTAHHLGDRPSQAAARMPSKLSQATPPDTVSSSSGSVSRVAPIRESASIQEETVNYLGYFSPYEVTMEQMLLTQARGAVRRIQSVFTLAKIHCRRDILWKRLTSSHSEDDRPKSSGATRSASSLTFSELEELLQLVEVQPVQDTDPRLSAFVRQPLRWQQELVKMIHAKYQHNVRNVTSEDGNEEHVAIMSPNCPHAVIVISTNLREPNNTSFRCVRKELKSDKSRSSAPATDPRINDFLAAFINICCFHLWASKL